MMALAGVMLPQDRELRLGLMALPVGKADPGRGGGAGGMGNGRGGASGRVWAALSQAHAQTGLVPFLLAGLDENDGTALGQRGAAGPLRHQRA
jgi:hypothetical protein